LKAYYHDIFTFPLPDNHRFPAEKYRRLREAVLKERLIAADELIVGEAALDDHLALVHSHDYISKVTGGGLNKDEVRQIGFPWSPELVERSLRSVGSTIDASRSALEDGVAINLAGGTHHAFEDHGEGFCVFNDAAVAARVMQREGRVERILIIDCDVHQGNGTAAIFEKDDSIYTFSIHGEKNYPFQKKESDLDIPLEDGTGDEVYLDALQKGAVRAFEEAEAQLAIYISGADPYSGDRLGRLSLTKEGLAARDSFILSKCRGLGLPVAIVMGGGYSLNVDDIVEIHLQSIRTAISLFETPDTE
jgi:acetoin utilization deacetylase AcuC-like enzyme